MEVISNIFSYNSTEESEAASKQVLAKSEQIRKFQEENKYLGQLVSTNVLFFHFFPIYFLIITNSSKNTETQNVNDNNIKYVKASL